ncbi:MAG TPA: sialidase family protein [Gemmataceae bacterium]|nr:sialidase family protein [Gemmataceae bacterium]
MNQQANPRSSWIVYAFLIAVIACGAAAGIYLSGLWPTRAASDAQIQVGPATHTHRFPLSERDAKDTVEAPELAVDAAGHVYLTWASKTGAAERTIFFTRSLDGGRTFETPRAVGNGGVFRSGGKGTREGHERRAMPRIALAGQQVHVTWSQADADGSRIRLMLTTSSDGGATFAEARPVSKADVANPTFTALALGARGEIGCAWLGSLGSQKVFAAVRPAKSTDFEADRLIHAGQDSKGVCPCCAVAACFAEDGTLYVGFRNLTDGYRDIAVGVLKPGKNEVEGPFPVTPPTWKFDGCPHDGPSLAVIGDTLHVVWMDARTGAQRCYHASAKRAEMKFSTANELRAIPAGTQGNAKLHVEGAGRLHAVWEESSIAPPADAKHQHGAPTLGKGGRAIYHAVLGPDGRFEKAKAVAPSDGAFQSRPCVGIAPDGRINIAWNELTEAGKAVVVRIQERETSR